jgi:hypothetical protein
MILLPATILYALRANDINRRAASRLEGPEPDPPPVVKFLNPLGPQIWLATEMADDDDVLHGVADLGFGCPEIGPWSLRELSKIRLPLGLRIQIDPDFETGVPLSVWAACSRRSGSILATEAMFGR